MVRHSRIGCCSIQTGAACVPFHTMPTETVIDELTLLDWKRRIFELYARVRDLPPYEGWLEWRRVRDMLVASHPQTPLGPGDVATFETLAYFPYDPGARCIGRLEPAEPEQRRMGTSTGQTIVFRRFAHVAFQLWGTACRLPVHWLEGYGGGVFLPFADATSGAETYGGGRYLLDTAKGSDLGGGTGELVLDFNFAYNPSCAYDPRWTCPLPPRDSRLPMAVTAGERSYPG
jgi:hypothetical protein